MHTYSNENGIYSIDMMIVYFNTQPFPVTSIVISTLENHLYIKGWGSVSSKGIKYSPSDVIRNPILFPKDFKNIKNSDTQYPIIICGNFIIDGLHRLAKNFMNKQSNINAYVITEELMSKFLLTSDISKKGWKYVDNLPIYSLIILYHNKFIHDFYLKQ
jgi:hypothetical protein